MQHRLTVPAKREYAHRLESANVGRAAWRQPMSVRRFPRNFACPFHLDRLVNAALIAFALVLLAAPARAEVKNVKIMMDWIIQGTHTPYLIAQEQGYFKAYGVTVDAIDRGMDATNVAVALARG